MARLNSQSHLLDGSISYISKNSVVLVILSLES